MASIVSIGLALAGSMDVRGGAVEDFDAFVKEKEKEFISYSQEEWNIMRDEKEQGIFIEEEELLAAPKVEKVEEVKPEEKKPALPPEGIGVVLPFESMLSITGRKMVSMKYGKVFYKDEEHRTTTGTPPGVTEGFDMNQELQVKIKGQVGRKITVNVDYDDTVEDKRDISVVYKGDPGEIVQEAAFGDITLELPATEFVGYSKSVFGGKVNAQYKQFKLMAIGSQTKGIPEEKKFKGASTFEKKDINDTSYRRRKYYKLWDEKIQSGSELVYIDDRDGTNNQNGAWMVVRSSELAPSTTYYGYFNLQVPGQDYTIDYVKGIITFSKAIYENYVIAVDYRKSDGTWLNDSNQNYPRILKDEDEELEQEMMNYYELGQKKIVQGVEGRDFIVKILDLNRNDVTATYFGNIYDLIEMDYDEGILKFKDREPFSLYPDIYNKTNPQHHYIIYVEYKYRQKTYFLQPNIVEGSEKITLNGRLLKRDEDYFIDYESGFITFLHEEEIDEETEIKINYEYMPFAGLFQETLLGARGEWSPSDRFFLGSTILYSGAAKPSTVPSMTATPGSILILDVNSDYSFDPQPFFPFKTKISGELARSLNNPNTWGKAIIDNMEGVKLTDGIPTDKDLWRIASNPGAEVTKEGAISWDNEDVRIKDFKPNADVGEDEKQEALKIDYNLDADKEASIVYPISTRGVDYSQKESLELYVYGDNKGETLEIRLGTIAEDADGDNELDTEDVNGDSTLNAGEDIGWDFKGWTGDDEKIYLKDGKIGYKNGRIDTEDLDGDRIGPEQDKGDGGTFSKTIDWSGWKKVSWDLNISTDPATISKWTTIKHIRITLKGGTSNVSGSIKITSIGVVGNKWQRGVVEGGGSFSVGALNTEEDYDDYGNGLLDNSYYLDLYGYRKGTSEVPKVEQTLSLKYTLTSGATGYTKWTFTRVEDYSKYEKLRFFVKKKPGSSGKPTFIMRLGTLTDYYEFRKEIENEEWELLTIDLVNEDGLYGADTMKSSDGTISKVGSPLLTNIPEIRLMIANNTTDEISGEIWVNEIHVTGVPKKEGLAGRLGLDFELPGWLTFGGKYWYMDRNFETITVPSKNQDREVISAYTNFNRLTYLPLSLNWSKTTTKTPSVFNVANLSVQDEGTVVTNEGTASAELRLPNLPRIGTSYGKTIVDRSQPESRKEDADTYSATLYQYELPIHFFLLPYDLGGSYKKIDKFTKFTSTAPSQNNFWEFTDDWSARATFRPLSKLSIVPSYSLRTVKEKVIIDGDVDRPRSGSQSVGFNSAIYFFEWLKPSVDYNITNNENFIIITSTSEPEAKNFTRSSSARLSMPFVAGALFPKFKPVASLNLTPSYELSDGDSYENIDRNYYIFDKLWLRDKDMGYKTLKGIEDKLKSFSILDTFRMETNWKPLDFLDLKGYVYPFKTITTKINYTHTQSHQGPTVLDSEKSIWPYLDIRMTNLEKFPLLGLVMQDAEVWTNYVLTTEDAKNVSLGKTVNFSEDLRFYLFKDYYFWLTYSNSWNRVKSAPSWEISREGFSKAYNAQVTFTWWKDWRFNLRYGYKKEEGETGGQKTTESRIHTPGIDVEARLTLPELWKIPLFGKIIKTTGEMRVKGRFTAEIKRSELNVEKDNTDTYSTLLSSDFNVGTNLMLTVGSGVTFFVNRVLPQNNYTAIDVTVTLTIKF